MKLMQNRRQLRLDQFIMSQPFTLPTNLSRFELPYFVLFFGSTLKHDSLTSSVNIINITVNQIIARFVRQFFLESLGRTLPRLL